MTFTWQGRRLNTATANGKALSFAYNADGIRTQKTVDGVTTYYTLDGTQIIRQKTGNTTVFFEYDANGTPTTILHAGTTYYYIRNVFGDVIGLADANGNTVVSYTYDPWGKLLSISDSTSTGIGTLNPFRYRGYYYDTETGLYYVSSRYYDPEIGRWINVDSILNQESVLGNNMFAYCLNNPANMADTTGHLPFFVVTAAIGAVIGAVAGGVVAAKNGGNVWAGIGIGAAAGALIGTGAGMAAGAALAGSITATTAQVAFGASTLATTVATGGVGAGITHVANNLQQVVSGNGGQVVSNAAKTGKNVYYQVTSSQAAQTIAKTKELIPSSVERNVCVLNFQPTIKQAQQLGAKSCETVIRFTTNCSTFVPDKTVPFAGAFRNMIDGPITVINVFEVGFK